MSFDTAMKHAPIKGISDRRSQTTRTLERKTVQASANSSPPSSCTTMPGFVKWLPIRPYGSAQRPVKIETDSSAAVNLKKRVWNKMAAAMIWKVQVTMRWRWQGFMEWFMGEVVFVSIQGFGSFSGDLLPFGVGLRRLA